MTKEGPGSWQEALDFLASAEPVGALAVAPGLVQASRDHARDLASGATSGHTGSDGSDIGQRMNRHG